jgi:hypothetical protein
MPVPTEASGLFSRQQSTGHFKARSQTPETLLLKEKSKQGKPPPSLVALTEEETYNMSRRTYCPRREVFDGTQVYRGSTTILGSDQPLTPDVVYPAGLKIYHLGSRLGQYVPSKTPALLAHRTEIGSPSGMVGGIRVKARTASGSLLVSTSFCIDGM